LKTEKLSKLRIEAKAAKSLISRSAMLFNFLIKRQNESVGAFKTYSRKNED
jgi:hypothetical protein